MEYKALSSSVPYQNIQLMMNKLQLTEADLLIVRQCKDVFIESCDNFAAFFYKAFYEIPETRILLERLGEPAIIKQTWSTWFRRLVGADPDIDFIGYIWRIGVKHVEVNLDQRFSNLGFSLVRQYCHRITLENFPPDRAVEIMSAIDKLIDFCISVETSAYIDSTVRCDIEILKGIADKIRNPVTIIGGNLRRLQRKLDPEVPLFKDYEFLISYTGRCEEMIEDINTYMETFQREALFGKCMLETIIENMIEVLSSKKKLEGVKVDIELSPDARFVWGDATDLRRLFYHLLENAAEASHASESPYVRVSSAPLGAPSNTVLVEIFNNGTVINLENIAKILSPFYSTKSEGSGLGLSIAKLVMRKNYGDMIFEPVPLQGTKVCVTLRSAD